MFTNRIFIQDEMSENLELTQIKERTNTDTRYQNFVSGLSSHRSQVEFR